MIMNKHIVTDALNKLKTEIQKLKIILIANSKDTPLSDRPNSKDIWIEFFNEQELEYLIQALRENDLFVEVYFAEQAFIKDILEHKYPDLNQLFVFNLARNGFGIGKKSLIPSFCDLMGIKYSGSSAYVCSLARNKYHCSRLFEHFDCCGTPTWVYDWNSGWFLGEKPPENLDIIIKPMFESASKGVTKDSVINTSDSQFSTRVHAHSQRSSEPVLIQKFIKGYECQVPFIRLMSDVFFSPVGICIGSAYQLHDKIITEDLSYHYSYGYYDAKQEIDNDVCNQLIAIAKKAAQIIGINTYGRIDFRIDENKNLFITDVATMPYIVEHSAFYHTFSNMGMTSKELLLSVICSALIHKYHYVV